MIKPEKSKYWIIGIIFVGDAYFLLPLVVTGHADEISSIILPLIFWSIPILGLLRDKKWARDYMWVVIFFLFFLATFAIGFAGDTGVTSALISLGIILIVVFFLIYLNIVFGRYIKSKVN